MHEASGLRDASAAAVHGVWDYDQLCVPLVETLELFATGPAWLDRDAFAARFAEIVTAARAGSGHPPPALGSRLPQGCSPAVGALSRTLLDRYGVVVHTHLLKTEAQASINTHWKGGLVAEMARRLVGRRGGLCPWRGLEPVEMEILARHGITLRNNPASTLIMGRGLMPFQACLAAGLRLELGCDAATAGGPHDLFGRCAGP